MIFIKDLCIELGDFRLSDINLHIEKETFYVLMGPTGVGKTVLLEAVCGLVPLQKGSIHVNGRDITSLPPEKHGVSIVYQDYCLFPHLSVYENIVYGLHFKKVPRGEMKEKVDGLVKELRIGHLLERAPATLSGGEMQRVALARALVTEPDVLLLDEPLSALDQQFREEMRLLLKNIHQAKNVTMLMVTHDLAEALFLAEKGAVMAEGRILQSGDVREIFHKPVNSFVADFVGMKNIFPAVFHGAIAQVNGMEIDCGRKINSRNGYVAIRPEDIVLSRECPETSARNSFPGIVTDIQNNGFFYMVTLENGGNRFHALVSKASLFDLDISLHGRLYFTYKAAAVHVF